MTRNTFAAIENEYAIPVCPECGSENIIATGDMRWDKNVQDWRMIVGFIPENFDCQDCDTVFFGEWYEKEEMENA